MHHQCDTRYTRLAELLARTGFKVIQENGQRVYYNPALDDKTFQPPRGCEVFVGCLPRDLYEDELVPMLELAGKLFKLRLMMDFNGKNRGYCFATYERKEEAHAAIELLNGHEIRPRCKIGVFKSLDNTRLFVGGIPVTKTANEVHEAFNEFVDGIQEVIMYPSNVNQNINRGYVFIEFESHRFAAIARRRLQPGSLVLWDSPILVDWAEPLPDPDPVIMSKVTKLYCRNISISMSSFAFQTELSKYIAMEYVHKVHKASDYAFLHFVTRATAEQALKQLTGVEIEGRPLEVMWARPEIYSNSSQRTTPPNHFCLSIPAKFRRIIRMRQKNKSNSGTPLVNNSFIYPERLPITMPMPPVMGPPVPFPNFILPLNGNGMVI